MNSLEINDKTYEIKFNYTFYGRVLDHFVDGKDKDGDDEVDGFNALLGALIEKDPNAIVKAYRFACVGKSLPALSDVASALDKAGIWDSEDPFGDLYKELKSVGFLALQIKRYLNSMKQDWKTSEIILSVAKDQAKTKEEKETVRQSEVETAGAKARYEYVKKLLEDLGK